MPLPALQVLLALPATYVRSQSYQCRAWAADAVGEGDASPPLSFWTPPAAPIMQSVLADDGQIFAYVRPSLDSGNKRASLASAWAGPACACAWVLIGAGSRHFVAARLQGCAVRLH